MVDTANGQIDIFLSDSTATLHAPVAYAAGPYPQSLITGDFNGDGKIDIAVMNSTDVAVLLGNGDGTFQAPITTSLSGGVSQFVAADFNKDGKLDLAVLSGTGVFLLLGNGDGTFQTPAGSVLPNGGSIATGDFNDDGIPDLAEYVAIAPGQSGLGVFYGNGDGSFQQPVYFTSAMITSLDATADFTGDGYSDLIDDGGEVYINTLEASATASLASATVQAGSTSTHNLVCSYPGDAHFAASVSAAVTENYSSAATPIFSLEVGNYASAQTVSISDGTTGAAIYYTSDGSTPTTSSAHYTAPIAVTSTVTLKAIAVAPAATTSPVSEVVYTLTAPPAVSISGGSYSAPQLVSLSDQTADAVIYYTTDGIAPTRASTQYTAPVTVAGTQTLSAMALAPGDLLSAVTTATYSAPLDTSTTTLQASAATGYVGQKIALTARVAGASPTGTVTFAAGAQSLGTATLTGGVATLQASFTTAGTYSVTASYAGDAGNAGSISSAISLTIAGSAFTIASTPTSQTISPGQAASYSLAIAPVVGYSGTLQLSCGSLPGQAACSFSSSSLTIAAGAQASTALTITTTAPTTSRNNLPFTPFGSRAADTALGLAALLGLGLSPRRMRRIRALAADLMLVALALPVVGCSSGGSTGVHNAGTPAGSYTVTVTAADSAGGAQNSVQVTLVVQ
jgi:hypothetical protein